MKLTRASTLPQVAVVGGEHLGRRGIRAVLTGGACVAIYTQTSTSKDADFVDDLRRSTAIQHLAAWIRPDLLTQEELAGFGQETLERASL